LGGEKCKSKIESVFEIDMEQVKYG